MCSRSTYCFGLVCDKKKTVTVRRKSTRSKFKISQYCNTVFIGVCAFSPFTRTHFYIIGKTGIFTCLNGKECMKCSFRVILLNYTFPMMCLFPPPPPTTCIGGVRRKKKLNIEFLIMSPYRIFLYLELH